MRKGWVRKSLQEICIVDWGNTKLTKASYVDGGEFLAVSAAGCDGRIGHKEHSAFTPVLSAIGARCGRMFLPEEDFTAIKNTITLTPLSGVVDGKFLYYLLTSVGLPQRGAGQPFISKGDIQKFAVDVPSLAEQQRIVAILDETFAGLATATANAEKNRENARELFESALNSVFRNEGDLVSLSTLASDITDGDHMPPPKAEQGVPFITISNIDKNTHKIDFADTFKVPQSYFANLKDNRKPRRGDVLYTVTGSFGIPVLVNSDNLFCFQRHIGLVRPKAGVNSQWLYYALRSKFAFDQAASGATGTAQKTVSLKLLRSIQLPAVSPAEQQSVTAKLNDVYEISQLLEAVYRRKIDSVTELKQSILQKAFSGALTSLPSRAIQEAAE